MGQSTPIGMDMSETAEKRHNMLMQSYERLQHLAFRAQSIYKWGNDKVVLVCISVDTEWRELVDAIMPETDWQKIRDQRMMPVARGTIDFSITEIIAKSFPNIQGVIFEIPAEGFYKCIALDEGGCTVYEIEPKENIDS